MDFQYLSTTLPLISNVIRYSMHDNHREEMQSSEAAWWSCAQFGFAMKKSEEAIMNHLVDEFSVFFCLQTICQQTATFSDVSIIWSSWWTITHVSNHGPLLRDVLWPCITMNLSRLVMCFSLLTG